MKNILKPILFVAVAAMAFTNCSKDGDTNPGTDGRMVTATISVDNDLISLSGEETRTEYNNGQIVWSADGEALKVVQVADGTTTLANTTNYQLTGGKATFEVSFPTGSASSYTYGAIYPQTNYASGTDAAQLNVNLPQVQYPGTGTFDAAADLMITRPIVSDTQITELNFAFGRIIAFGKMTVKQLGIQAGEYVKKVIVTVPNKTVTGRGRVNLVNGSVLTDQWGYSEQYNFDNVEIRYDDDVINTSEFDVWFSCIPASLNEGETITVEILSSRGTYKRTLTLGAGQNLNFTMGDISAFGFNMSSAEFDETEADDSIFTIPFGSWSDTQNHVTYTASYDMEATGTGAEELAYSFSAATNQIRANSNRFNTTDYEGASGGAFWWAAANANFVISNVNVNDAEFFTLSFGAKTQSGTTSIQPYLSIDGGTNYFPLSETAISVTSSAELKEMNFTFARTINTPCQIKLENTTSTGAIIDDVRLVALDTEGENSYLVDFVVDPYLTTTPANGGTLSFAAGDGEAPAPQTITYDYGGDGVELEIVKDSNDTWYTIQDHENGTITVTPTENTGDQARSGKVTLSVIKDYTVEVQSEIIISQAASGATIRAYEKVTATPTDWSGKYIISSGTNAANGVIASSWLTATTVTITSDAILSTDETDAIAVDIAQNGDGFYTIQFSTGYLRTTNANNGINVVAAASANDAQWSLTYNTDGTVSIANRAYTTRVLRYSTDGNGGYRTYTGSTGTLPSLYKLN